MKLPVTSDGYFVLRQQNYSYIPVATSILVRQNSRNKNARSKLHLIFGLNYFDVYLKLSILNSSIVRPSSSHICFTQFGVLLLRPKLLSIHTASFGATVRCVLTFLETVVLVLRSESTISFWIRSSLTRTRCFLKTALTSTTMSFIFFRI